MINCACSASLKLVVMRSSFNQMHASSNLTSMRTKKVGSLVTSLYVSVCLCPPPFYFITGPLRYQTCFSKQVQCLNCASQCRVLLRDKWQLRNESLSVEELEYIFQWSFQCGKNCWENKILNITSNDTDFLFTLLRRRNMLVQ
jgi:hypothetical protein